MVLHILCPWLAHGRTNLLLWIFVVSVTDIGLMWLDSVSSRHKGHFVSCYSYCSGFGVAAVRERCGDFCRERPTGDGGTTTDDGDGQRDTVPAGLIFSDDDFCLHHRLAGFCFDPRLSVNRTCNEFVRGFL